MRKNHSFVLRLMLAAMAFCCAAGAEEEEADFLTLADSFRPHCVRVRIQAQSFNGEMPPVGDFADDIRNERPSFLGGYWWDDTHVIIPDQGLQDRFIESMEIALPGSHKTYPARAAGRFVALQGVLLEVLPDEDGIRPEAHPLEFSDGDIDEAFLFSYVWEEGDWLVKTDTGLGVMTVSDDGREAVAAGGTGVFIDDDGRPLGLAFGEQLPVEDVTEGGVSSWRGAELSSTPLFSARDAEEADGEMKKRLADAVLECHFRLRVKVDDDETHDASAWMEDGEGGPGQGRDASEIRAAGLVAGPRRLLVPLALSGAGIRRIEDITVTCSDGRELKAAFVGALSRYRAVVIAVEEDLPPGNPPAGFDLFSPAAESDGSAASGPRPADGYIRRWLVDYDLGRRRELADYDRWLGDFRGFRGDVIVKTMMSEKDGHLAFDVDGALAAVSLTPRLVAGRNRSGASAHRPGPGFRPVAFLRRKLSEPGAFDRTLVPMAEEEGRRMIDLGAEFQTLDAETSRLFNVSRETRGGDFGVLVSHVYPGSIAGDIGLRERDVLLRLFVEGRREPVELSAGASPGSGLDMDMSSESFRQLLEYLPAPWPPRDNRISRVLTEAGPGRAATLEYARDGRVLRAEFETRYGEPDYGSAAKERFRGLGLTVKPVTFEVARYFGRPEDSGVVVSHVEPGGRGSVAGLSPFLLITHVDGVRVTGMEAFKAGVSAFEEGAGLPVELTVEDFGRTRLVKIE